MKNKIFLVVSMIMLLACMLAVSVSAAANDYFGNVEIIDNNGDGASDINISDMVHTIIQEGDGAISSASARMTISCDCEAGKHTFPAYYITSPKSTARRFYCFSFDAINSVLPGYCGTTSKVSASNVTAYELPNGYNAIYSGFFYEGGGSTYKGDGIEYFSFATCSTLTSFEGTASGKNWFTNSTIEEVDLGPYVTNIPVMLFYNCDSLEYITIPDQITTMDRLAFAYSDNLKRVYFTENSLLTTIGDSVFDHCGNLEAFYIPPRLTTLGGSSSNQSIFNCCTKIYFLNNPNETEKPDVYYLPSSILKFDGEIFKSCQNLNNTIVFPENATSIPNGWAFNGANAVNVVCLGNMENVSTTGNAWNSNVTIYFCNPADKSTADLTGINTSAKKVFCNADGNTTHLYKVSVNRAPTCTVDGVNGFECFCGEADPNNTITTPAPGHAKTTIEEIAYNGANRFFEKGDVTYICGTCGENHTVEDDASVIFVSLGLSGTERNTGAYAIIQGFKIDHVAKDLYNQYTENDVVGYGLVAGTKLALGENAEIFDNTGAVTSTKAGVVKISERDEKYDIFEMKISGLEAKHETYDFSAIDIYCCGYCLVQIGDNVVSFYASEGVVTATLSITTSYNALQPISQEG